MTKKRKADTTTTTPPPKKTNNNPDGRRRSTRLNSSPPTLNPSLKVSSPATFLACSKVKNPYLKRYSFSVSPRRFNKVEKGRKRVPDSPPNEAQESEGNSSSKSPSGFEALRNEFKLPSSKQLKSASKVHGKQQGQTPSKSSPATTGGKLVEYSNLLADNVLNNENEDIRDAGASRTAASFVGTTLVVANIVEGRVEEIANANPTVSYGLTEIANMWGGEGFSEDEIESSSGIPILGKYSVKEAWEPIVKSVIDKYGDIAANYFNSPKSRSCALENLAEFIQTFQRKKFVELTESEIEKALEFVSDFCEGGLDVGWLQLRLKDLLEARQMVKQSSKLKEKKDKINEVIKQKKEELRVALAEAERIKATTAKVKYFVDHPPLDGLF